MNPKAIITSALPYANGEIHLGHVASTYLPADVTTRFLRQKGVEAYYICASDDFGTPILIQSEKEGKTPEEYVEYWNKRDFEDFTALNIKFDFFYKTSSPENKQFVQDVFKKLEHHNLKKLLNKGLIVMVNSDDPAYFGGYLNTNLIECQMALNLTKEDIKRLAINSFRSSFLSEDEKKKWIDQINNLV